MIIDVLSEIRNRRTYRNFINDKTIPKETIQTILKAAFFSPSARNTKKWQFVVVENRQILQQLGDMKPHSHHISEASCVIIICSEYWQYWIEDVSIASENILLEATHQGLASGIAQIHDSSCQHHMDPEDYVRKVLTIPTDINIFAMIALGYPKAPLSPHSEEEYQSNKVHFEKW